MSIWKRLRRFSESSRGKWLLQFIKFGMVGVSNTLLSMGIYYLGVYCLKLHYQISNLIGFIVSVTNAYFWNSRYVFGDGSKKSVSQHAKAYVKTLLSYGAVFLLTIVLLWAWVEKLHISEGIAPILNLIITVPLNFVLNKFWTFRKK